MATRTDVLDYVKKFIESVGIDPKTCWNEENKAYYLYKGSAKIEVFVSEHKQDDGSIRYYLRVFSGIIKVPGTNKEKFYRRLLEINDQSLGIKLTLMPEALPENDWVYATYERDIVGISYEEIEIILSDVGLWADYFDDELKKEFSDQTNNIT